MTAARSLPATGTQRLVCQHCQRPLGASPSPDFCSETCQQQWQASHPTGTTTTEPPVGEEVLDAVAAFVARFNAFPSQHCAPTLALWYAHTHIADHLYITPRLILDSAEPGSGKTRVLEVAQFLVAAPEMTISPSVAALFRLVAQGPITILFDEIDAVFNPKTSAGGGNEDLRALLNAGYKCSATIPRCVGDAKAMKVQRFKTYAPAALAGIAGGMPDTITTRAITLHLRRRRRDERVEAFRERKVEQQAAPICEALAAWITPLGAQIGEAEPEMPDGVVDRSAEIWEPLLAIADQAGGHWPDTARAACRHFVLNGRSQGNSLGIRLLADIQQIFHQHGADRMTTAGLLADLIALEEAPWADLDSKPLDARRLARELGRYGIKSKDIKTPGAAGALKGYRIDGDDGLADAWQRYLPTAATSATSATNATEQVTTVAATMPVADNSATATTSDSGQAVADTSATGQPSATALTRQVADVADDDGGRDE